MPKLINHEERKQEIAQAVWTVISREGIRGVSVRTVAAEANISTGSLRHVFPSLDEMMIYSTDYVGKKFIKSVSERQVAGTLADNVEKFFNHLTPISEDGKIFAEVVAGMMAEAVLFPGVLPVLREHENDFTYTYSFFLSQMRAHGILKPGIDIQLETDKLVALLWGINSLYLLSDRTVTKDHLLAPIQTHLRSLLAEPPSA